MGKNKGAVPFFVSCLEDEGHNFSAAQSDPERSNELLRQV
jgi:hypothetical protein